MSDTRQYPARPIVGVGAVIVQDDQVVLIRRRYEPRKGQWTLPGGGVDSSATSTTGATYTVTGVVAPATPACSINPNGTGLTFLKDGSCTLSVTVPADRGYKIGRAHV